MHPHEKENRKKEKRKNNKASLDIRKRTTP